jgi:hypothetical protein
MCPFNAGVFLNLLQQMAHSAGLSSRPPLTAPTFKLRSSPKLVSTFSSLFLQLFLDCVTQIAFLCEDLLELMKAGEASPVLRLAPEVYITLSSVVC